MSDRTWGTGLSILVHAYVECPHCGRIPKPSVAMGELMDMDAPEKVHCRLQCERCGSDAAMLYLERELIPSQLN